MSNVVLANSSFPTPQEFAMIRQLGEAAVKSGFLPNGIKTVEQAVIIMLKAREIGVPPMQAFSSIAVINGKPTMSAELMLSLIYRNVPGARIDYDEISDKICRIYAGRPNGKVTLFSFSMDDAARANLAGRGPWVTYPSAMLRARCISAMARAMFPDALSGVVYTPEELGANVDGDGNIVNQTVSNEPKDVTPPAAAVVIESNDPGEYEIPASLRKYAGRKIKDCPVFDLGSYVDFLADNAKKLNKPPSHDAQMLTRKYDEYRAQLDAAKKAKDEAIDDAVDGVLKNVGLGSDHRKIRIDKREIIEFCPGDREDYVTIDGAPFDGTYEDAIAFVKAGSK